MGWKPGWRPDPAIDRDPGASEFGQTRGLVPKGKEMASPREGGMYAALCPPTNPDDRGTQRYSYPGERVTSVGDDEDRPYRVLWGNADSQPHGDVGPYRPS